MALVAGHFILCTKELQLMSLHVLYGSTIIVGLQGEHFFTLMSWSSPFEVRVASREGRGRTKCCLIKDHRMYIQYLPVPALLTRI